VGGNNLSSTEGGVVLPWDISIPTFSSFPFLQWGTKKENVGMSLDVA
jgi:hypothetical protein